MPPRTPAGADPATSQGRVTPLAPLAGAEVYCLGIDYATFDPAQALSLRAAVPLVLGRGGRPACIESLRNWCKRGVKPWGPSGPTLYFPAVVSNNAYWTMPAWVERFEAARRVPATRRRPGETPGTRPETPT